jgi:hypothetical protein
VSEWEKYSCKISTGKRAGAGDCAALEDVYHVAHVPDARRIIEDKKLKARLVYDESKLNQTRMHVCWVSANSWHPGSIYGTVEFTFRWADLVEGKQIYWVEAMTGYSPHAYRFLLTDRDLGSLKHVPLYDPNTEDGPLRKNGNAWLWNGDHTAEFMIDSDVPISLCKRLNFISHNQKNCRLFGSSCKERSQDWVETSACILGYLIGAGITTVNKALTPDIGLPNGKPSMQTIEGGVGRLWLKLGGNKPLSFSGPVKCAASAKHIVRAAILQYAFGNVVEARGLVSALNSSETLEATLLELTREHFELPDFNFF